MVWDEVYRDLDKYRQRIRGRVVDVGTGFGNSLTYLTGVEGVSEIVTIDPDDWSLEGARREFSSLIGSGKLRVVKAFSESIPYPDGYFDAAISLMVMHHLPDPTAGIREVERIVKGLIYIADWLPGYEGHPHDPKVIQEKAESVKDFSQSRGFKFTDHGRWYSVVRVSPVHDSSSHNSSVL